MTDNLETWNKLKRVPEEHLKGFTRGGGFKGTAIKPMWSVMRMTEVYGPVGIGWGMDAPVFETHKLDNGEILVFCTVAAWAENGSKVYGVGGDKVVAQFSSGFKVDDEAYKKAYTDALTNALKFFGVGADIHMGLWDGNKYVDEAPEPQGKPAQAYDRNPIVKEAYEKIDKGLNQIDQMGTIEDLKAYWEGNSKTIAGLPADWKAMLEQKKEDMKEKFGKAAT